MPSRTGTTLPTPNPENITPITDPDSYNISTLVEGEVEENPLEQIYFDNYKINLEEEEMGETSYLFLKFCK